MEQNGIFTTSNCINNPNSSTTFVDVSGGGTLNLTYTDACGNNLSDGVTIYCSCHSGYSANNFTDAPNPAQNDMTVSTVRNNNTTNAKQKLPLHQILSTELRLQMYWEH